MSGLVKKSYLGTVFPNDLLFSHVATFQLLNQKSRIVWSFWTLPIKNVETYFDMAYLFPKQVSSSMYVAYIMKGFKKNKPSILFAVMHVN